MTYEEVMAVKLANQWITSDNDFTASAGWTAYSMILRIQSDEALPQEEIRGHRLFAPAPGSTGIGGTTGQNKGRPGESRYQDHGTRSRCSPHSGKSSAPLRTLK